MKHLLLSLAISIILTIQIFPQWYQQNIGTNSNLFYLQFMDENTGWAMGGVPFEGDKLFKTTNGGMDWIDQGTALPFGAGTLTNFFFLNESTGWFEAYSLVGETSSIFKTTDGGQTWFLQSQDYAYIVLSDIWFADALTGYTAGNGELSTGFVYKTTDGGENWNLLVGAVNSIMTSSLYFINQDTGWAAGANILKTTNGGVTWQEQFNFEPSIFTSIQFVDDQTGWAVSDSLYKTTDGGNTWFPQSAAASTRTFFADILNGWMISGSDIYHSGDGGDNWTLQNSNTTEVLKDIFFVDQSKGWAVGYNSTILHTINGGTPVELVSFNAVTDGNEVVLNWETATEKNNRGFDVQRSEVGDRRSEWISVGFVEGNGTMTERHTYGFTDIDVSPGDYVYRLKQIDYDGSYEYSNEVEVNVNAPLKFALEQNYPNPFNPTTRINYSIPSARKVVLKVYDALGRDVATLVNDQQAAGNYTVDFNASDLASGIYFYRLQTGDFVQMKKMILMK